MNFKSIPPLLVYLIRYNGRLYFYICHQKKVLEFFVKYTHTYVTTRFSEHLLLVSSERSFAEPFAVEEALCQMRNCAPHVISRSSPTQT